MHFSSDRLRANMLRSAQKRVNSGDSQLPINSRHRLHRRNKVQCVARRAERRVPKAAAAGAPPATQPIERHASAPPATPVNRDRSHETDYVVIGSGIGGEV
jgi:hypothetical protein